MELDLIGIIMVGYTVIWKVNFLEACTSGLSLSLNHNTVMASRFG
jgi:hypothetical protein